jgi:MULE transposase domain
LAIGRDGNNQGYLIAWAIVESENADSWTWFIEQLVLGCPAINQSVHVGQTTVQPTVMSDRDKGLLKAEIEAIPNAHRAFYCWHLAENVKNKFGQAARKEFWGLVYVQTESQWKKALEKLEEARGKVSIYLYLELQ